MKFSVPQIVQLWTILVAVFGFIVGIVMWVYPFFSIAGFLEGVVLDFLFLGNVLMEVFDFEFWDYFRFFKRSWGKAGFYLIIGALVAGTDAIWIAAWTICWVTAAIWALMAVIPACETPVPLTKAFGSGQSGTQESPNPDNYTPLT